MSGIKPYWLRAQDSSANESKRISDERELGFREIRLAEIDLIYSLTIKQLAQINATARKKFLNQPAAIRQQNTSRK
ncbi:hypothetical protein M1512_01525 [Patescibacteria group bacterium]|jgi:hypothetical protein|nr:hypothetical protein [Patescibacteria group bacterium]